MKKLMALSCIVTAPRLDEPVFVFCREDAGTLSMPEYVLALWWERERQRQGESVCVFTTRGNSPPHFGECCTCICSRSSLSLSLSLSHSFPRITLTNFSDNSIPLMKGTIHLLPYRTIRTLLHQHRVELL